MSKSREIPLDAIRMVNVLFASLIDEGRTDHEILTMCEETLRTIRAELSTSSRTATELAIDRAKAWTEKS